MGGLPGADEEDAPEAKALPAGAASYLTREGYERFRAEFRHLVTVERPKVVEVVHWAAGNGDRSENGDYIYGKKRLREIDRRIRFLDKRLDKARVVDPAQQTNRAQVFFGATVTYADEQDRRKTVTIVGADEADMTRARVSLLSPIARALLKAAVGDLVTFQAPAGLIELEILAISYQ
ncbi:MAG: transcription elongation factor GreB [Rhodospirillales bacterium]|nr:transcription elongation factor GreB [Rhodospirillales bacterium]